LSLLVVAVIIDEEESVFVESLQSSTAKVPLFLIIKYYYRRLLEDMQVWQLI